MGTPATVTSLTERLLAKMKPHRGRHRADGRERRVTEDADFLAMLWRLVRTLEERSIERPENLLQVMALVQRFNEVVNVTIAANAERYARDPKLGASLRECGRILGISSAAAHGRKVIGERIMAERLDAAGVTRINARGEARQISSEVVREREAIETAAAAAVVAIGDYLARRAA